MKLFIYEKREVNYLYFSFFLIFLTVLSFYHYVAAEQPLSGMSLFFLLYALGQAFLETSLFILIAHLLQRWAPPWTYRLFISISFLSLLLHFTHFTMVRLMDTSITYIFKFFFGSGVDHVIAGFQALNMNMTMIALTVGTFILIPLVGLTFYSLTDRLARLKPLRLSLAQIGLTMGLLAISLFSLDLFIQPFLSQTNYHKYQKTLPLGTTFFPPSPNRLSLPHSLAPMRDETEIAIPSTHLAHLPNIYLFVIETLRRDFVNGETAPYLTQFGCENIQFERSFANSHATHLSWFAIFHADLPFYWSEMRDAWKKGSIPLRFLKELGYQIHVRSSADLRYFNMDKLIFGANRELAETIEEYTFDRSIDPCDRDALALASIQKELKQEGQLYLIFLDSTHSEYSFPKDRLLKFKPISQEIEYLTIGPKSPELEGIKNRYRNAIHYVDEQIGDFFSQLKKKNLYDDAIIAITGDHGEEFFEEGALFHGTHLNHFQTSVPLFLKFPLKEWIPKTAEATHLDIFPSILHYLTHQSDFSPLFDGQSIFSPNRWPFRIAVHQNGPDTPLEFFLENSDLKLQARFVTPSQIDIIALQGSLDPSILAPLLKKEKAQSFENCASATIRGDD